ncbi:DUF805 domain-containing protein [Robertkochia sediminum]|uniref:DUF805 domain-containing protein n=1 Tax=Robertkochia sediminum TaxID=2785326 RepID=UPI0019331323|nr:DUF805 domain-containing protein [Robertkochia sediminum]MBL7471409.1 DUF805 domain-containing protein [Robertkochia sediminum]
MNWYLKCFKQYADFSGRAGRTEFWMFFVINKILIFLALMIDHVVGTSSPDNLYGVFSVLYLLAVFIPALAVRVRRLHDVGESGWMLLIGVIPVIGTIWLFVLYITKGHSGTNKWGPNPKEEMTLA